MSTDAKVSPDQRFTASNPCPICGGHEDIKRGIGERCTGFYSGSGKFAFCERASSDELVDTATGHLYKHRLNGPCGCGSEHGPALASDAPARRPRKAVAAGETGRRKKIHPNHKKAVEAHLWGLRQPKKNKAGEVVVEADDSWHEAGLYIYRNAAGLAVMMKLRAQNAEGRKEYRPIGKVESGWITADPPGKLPPYNLDKLTADPESTLWVFEGEKCCEAAGMVGILATTSSHGAGSAHKTDWSALAGRDVVICPDNDQAGENYLAEVVAKLNELSEPPSMIRVVRLQGLEPGGDVADWLAEVAPDTWEPERCRAELMRLAEIAKPIVPEDASPEPDPSNLASISRTEFGLAERMNARYGPGIRYCWPWQKFMAYDGRRWKTDDAGEVPRWGKATVRKLLGEAATLTDAEEIKDYAKWAMESHSARKLAAMLKLLQSEPGIPILPADMDSDPWVLNVLNGTLDLRTGELRPHRRRDNISHLAPVEFKPGAECPLWNGTLDLVFAGNRALVRYFQRLAGYFITGAILDHILPVFWGSGSNGKSTLLNTLMELLGPDLAFKANPELLLVKTGNSHPTERASLFGKRLVVGIETDEGRRLNESMVKELTGGDIINARRMREDEWQFKPTHKLALGTNHKPGIRGTDMGIWRRVQLVPFTVTIPTESAVKDMPDQLRREMPGILNWALEGCRLYQLEGLNPPDEVMEATAEYKAEQDVLGAFIAEECIVDSNLKKLRDPRNTQVKAKASELYKRYKTWAEGAGEFAVNQKRFGTALTERGFGRYTNDGIWYGGIGLRPEESDYKVVGI